MNFGLAPKIVSKVRIYIGKNARYPLIHRIAATINANKFQINRFHITIHINITKFLVSVMKENKYLHFIEFYRRRQ